MTREEMKARLLLAVDEAIEFNANHSPKDGKFSAGGHGAVGKAQARQMINKGKEDYKKAPPDKKISTGRKILAHTVGAVVGAAAGAVTAAGTVAGLATFGLGLTTRGKIGLAVMSGMVAVDAYKITMRGIAGIRAKKARSRKEAVEEKVQVRPEDLRLGVRRLLRAYKAEKDPKRRDDLVYGALDVAQALLPHIKKA